MHDCDDDVNLALVMADRADALTTAAFTGGVMASAPKADGTPVTETDILVEETVRELVVEHLRDDGFVGEETTMFPLLTIPIRRS